MKSCGYRQTTALWSVPLLRIDDGKCECVSSRGGGSRSASPSIVLPTAILPAAPPISSSPPYASPTANVGTSLGSSHPIDTPLLTPAKSQSSVPATLSTLPISCSHLSEMATRASRVRSIPRQVQRQAPVTSFVKLVDHSPIEARIAQLSGSTPIQGDPPTFAAFFDPVALQGPTPIQADPSTLIATSDPSILQGPTLPAIGQIIEVIASSSESLKQQKGKTQKTKGLVEAMIELA
ncbi:hypothetical protein LWI28_004951 [Acer negundo]|uniref:Uncharacterized protein n=1 Tax=Acer negundo TaxID=4023 RepID=A0AAD5NZE9_ACENE|nr:hypothetical protein LWI28_004951 [Acer negundo]